MHVLQRSSIYRGCLGADSEFIKIFRKNWTLVHSPFLPFRVSLLASTYTHSYNIAPQAHRLSPTLHGNQDGSLTDDVISGLYATIVNIMYSNPYRCVIPSAFPWNRLKRTRPSECASGHTQCYVHATRTLHPNGKNSNPIITQSQRSPTVCLLLLNIGPS
jgi:hypothetical protein